MKKSVRGSWPSRSLHELSSDMDIYAVEAEHMNKWAKDVMSLQQGGERRGTSGPYLEYERNEEI